MKLEVGKFYYKVDVNQYLIVITQRIKLTKEKSPGRFKYKVIEQTVDRSYEISETIEEKLKKKYHGYDGYFSGREIRNTLGGESNFNEKDLFEEISQFYILERVEERKKQLQRVEESQLYCPITGGRLICVGQERGVMDGSNLWVAVDYEGKELLKWETGSRWISYIYDNPTYGYYKWYPDEKEWRKQVRCEDGWTYVDEPKTPEEQVALDKRNSDYREEQKKRDEEYQRKLASGEIKVLFPIFTKVFAKTMDLNITEVKPMNGPSGQLFYLDSPFDFEDEDDNE